jgi:hypothetical protein
MDDIEQKREELKKLYPSYSWQYKVDKMSPAQVTAIYLRFKSEGKLGK